MSANHVKVLLHKGIVVATLLVWVLLAGIAPVFGRMGDGTIKIDDQDGSLSIDVYEVRVSEVFQDLAGKTPYEFVVPEALGNSRVTLKCFRLDLHAAIRRIIGNTGVDNFALIYSHREAKPERKPQWQLKVVVMEGDAGGTEATFFQPRQVPVPSAMLNSGKVPMELVLRPPVSLESEVPTPVMLSPETGDFPDYRILEKDQIPVKIQILSPP